MKKKSTAIREIREEIEQIPIIDTHEHVRKQASIRREGANLFTSLKYNLGIFDFISAGMPAEEWDPNIANLQEFWDKIKPYIDSVQTTAYFRTIMVAYRDLFKFEDREITSNNWEHLSNLITKAYKRDDLYELVFQKLNISRVLVDVIEDPGSLDMPSQSNVYIPTLAIDPFIFVRSQKFFIANPPFSPRWFNSNPLTSLMKRWEVSYGTFEEYIALIDFAFEKLKNVGGVAIKFRFSYFRDMNVQAVSKSEAKKIFNFKEEDLTKEQVKRLEDYLIRTIIKKATDNNIPIQVHTGAFGNCGNDPRKGHPFQLINLFTEFTKTKFIIFHGSYPFTGEMVSLVKGFPNVYLDMCWPPWLLYNNFQKYLSEWLSVIPCNKIVLGGDTECIERLYSAFSVAKGCIAEVLYDYIERDIYSKNMALNVAKKILRENAKEIYRV